MDKRAAELTPDKATGSATSLARSLAEVVSAVFSPPIVAAVCLWFALFRLGAAHPRGWTILYIMLGVAVPALYVLWLLRRGQVTDLDVSWREQRKRPMEVMVVCSALAWILLWVLGANRGTLILTGALTLQAMILLAITLRWKISQHSAMSAWAGLTGWFLLDSPLTLLLMPLVVWSRVRLGRHTVAEAIAGAALGLAISSAAVWLIRMA